MNKIPITIATISQYTIPETILFEIPLLNCPKESVPVTNSRNRFMISLPIVPKKVIQSLRKTGERIAVNSVVAMLYHANRNIQIRDAMTDILKQLPLDLTKTEDAFSKDLLLLMLKQYELLQMLI